MDKINRDFSKGVRNDEKFIRKATSRILWANRGFLVVNVKSYSRVLVQK